ncbi:hypothetical protein EMPG_16608, partial [Blastomyces silverae]
HGLTRILGPISRVARQIELCGDRCTIRAGLECRCSQPSKTLSSSGGIGRGPLPPTGFEAGIQKG